ncbi:unnamed protein product [Ixodes persulcatus]
MKTNQSCLSPPMCYSDVFAYLKTGKVFNAPKYRAACGGRVNMCACFAALQEISLSPGSVRLIKNGEVNVKVLFPYTKMALFLQDSTTLSLNLLPFADAKNGKVCKPRLNRLCGQKV